MSGSNWESTAGSIIGGAAGTLIPIPVVGTMIGSYLGGQLGDVVGNEINGKPAGQGNIFGSLFGGGSGSSGGSGMGGILGGGGTGGLLGGLLGGSSGISPQAGLTGAQTGLGTLAGIQGGTGAGSIIPTALSQYQAGASGQLTPAQAAAAGNALNEANMSTMAGYSNLGLGDSTMASQDIAQNQLQNLAEQANLEAQSEALGLSGLNTGLNYTQAAAGNLQNISSDQLNLMKLLTSAGGGQSAGGGTGTGTSPFGGLGGGYTASSIGSGIIDPSTGLGSTVAPGIATLGDLGGTGVGGVLGGSLTDIGGGLSATDLAGMAGAAF
jgi:hypothetical protein